MRVYFVCTSCYSFQMNVIHTFALLIQIPFLSFNYANIHTISPMTWCCPESILFCRCILKETVSSICWFYMHHVKRIFFTMDGTNTQYGIRIFGITIQIYSNIRFWRLFTVNPLFRTLGTLILQICCFTVTPVDVVIRGRLIEGVTNIKKPGMFHKR